MKDFKNSILAYKNIKKDGISHLGKIFFNYVGGIRKSNVSIDDQKTEELHIKKIDILGKAFIKLSQKHNVDNTENILRLVEIFLSDRPSSRVLDHQRKMRIIKSVLALLGD